MASVRPENDAHRRKWRDVDDVFKRRWSDRSVTRDVQGLARWAPWWHRTSNLHWTSSLVRCSRLYFKVIVFIVGPNRKTCVNLGINYQFQETSKEWTWPTFPNLGHTYPPGAREKSLWVRQIFIKLSFTLWKCRKSLFVRIDYVNTKFCWHP